MHDIFYSNSLLFITFIIIFPHHIKQTERQMERYWTTWRTCNKKKPHLNLSIDQVRLIPNIIHKYVFKIIFNHNKSAFPKSFLKIRHRNKFHTEQRCTSKYITNFPCKTRAEKRKCTAVSEKITAALYILFFLLLKKNELCFKDIKASQC